MLSCYGESLSRNPDREELTMPVVGPGAARAARLAALVACSCLALPAFADLPVEELTVAPPISARNRAYIGDVAINYIADGKLHVVDTDTGRYLGVVGSGFAGQYILKESTRELLIATGYLSRGQRGERTDILEVWDADSLSFKYEIPIVDKRAMALNYRGLLELSADGRWAFVQNATPATSVSVVDLEARKMAAEIPTPGCWGIYVPSSKSDRFSTLCGDGTVATILLDGSGQQASRAVSGKLFDPERDAWFIQGERDGDTYRFVSFQGNVAAVDIGGDAAKLGETWSLVGAADKKKGWRPGGYQPLAVHAGTGRLYVTMHPGGAEGSHKNPAKEIWTFDLASRKRINRMPGHASIALTTSKDGKRLMAIDIEKATLLMIDVGAKPRVRHSTQVGAVPAQVNAF
jgi:methylamine dehydrogenase heavy chain